MCQVALLQQRILRHIALKRVLVYLSHSSADRPHGNLNTLWYFFSRFSQAFKHQLPGKIYINIILEHYCDYRKAELCNRTQLFNIGQAPHCRLNRIGNITLNLNCR